MTEVTEHVLTIKHLVHFIAQVTLEKRPAAVLADDDIDEEEASTSGPTTSSAVGQGRKRARVSGLMFVS